MIELWLVLFIALIAAGWCIIWLHDNSANRLWQSKWWGAVGMCAVFVGVFGATFSLGEIFGGVLN